MICYEEGQDKTYCLLCSAQP